jgi:hypothetical protein
VARLSSPDCGAKPLAATLMKTGGKSVATASAAPPPE